MFLLCCVRIFFFFFLKGITASNNFLGLPPPPYSMSTLKNSFSSSTIDTFVPESTTNQQARPAFSYRQTSRSMMDLNQYENSYYRPSSPYVSSRPSLFNQTREKERLELSTLNDKFADYVEKVRYLEAQNKKIQMETTFLSDKQHENSQRIKSMFEVEMKQLKEIIERTFKDKSTMLAAAKDAQVFHFVSFLKCCVSFLHFI